MNRLVPVLALVVLVGAGAYFYVSYKPSGTDQAASLAGIDLVDATVPITGLYKVNIEKSIFNWSAKKPLIDGYINSGTIKLKEGTLIVDNEIASGTIVLDMNTIKVGLTAAKPGQEGALEKHLKTADFFDVPMFPTATFVISKVARQAGTVTEPFRYDVRGLLTIRNRTNEAIFPAVIYWKDDALRVRAETEIDRTKWGLTYGSGSFFKNLGDNAIADMVAISFSLVATK